MKNEQANWLHFIGRLLLCKDVKQKQQNNNNNNKETILIYLFAFVQIRFLRSLLSCIHLVKKKENNSL